MNQEFWLSFVISETLIRYQQEVENRQLSVGVWSQGSGQHQKYKFRHHQPDSGIIIKGLDYISRRGSGRVEDKALFH